MKEETQFAQWESKTFGYGYGNGEYFILPLLKKFFENFTRGDNQYDFQHLEKELGETNTWFLINGLCRVDAIEYGTSPRFGWLTSKGIAVKDFVLKHTNEELYEYVTNAEYSDFCECEGEIKGEGHEFCGKNPMINSTYSLM